MNVSKLLETVNSLAPLDCAFGDDFVGITVGSEDSKVNGLAVAHELENNILKYSIDNNNNALNYMLLCVSMRECYVLTTVASQRWIGGE